MHVNRCAISTAIGLVHVARYPDRTRQLVKKRLSMVLLSMPVRGGLGLGSGCGHGLVLLLPAPSPAYLELQGRRGVPVKPLARAVVREGHV